MEHVRSSISIGAMAARFTRDDRYSRRFGNAMKAIL